MIGIRLVLSAAESELLERTLFEVLEVYQGDTRTHEFLQELAKGVRMVRGGKEGCGLEIGQLGAKMPD